MANPNLGWLFYKEYYNRAINYQDKDSEKNADVFEPVNKTLFNAKWDEVSLQSCMTTEQKIEFTTTYPGLLIGSGYNHETGCKGEIKMGFFFDHTTGQPMLPGSSVKGIIKQAFKQPAYVAYLLNEVLKIPCPAEQIPGLEQEIFVGEGHSSMYEHDVFFDALITNGDKIGKMLASDFITPHHDPLRNPIPLSFLKIRPEVGITFYFDLKNSKVLPGLKASEKIKLFQLILQDSGVGAKTNVGYGHLIPKIPIVKGGNGDQKTSLTDLAYIPLDRVKRGKPVQAEVLRYEGRQGVVRLGIEGYDKEVRVRTAEVLFPVGTIFKAVVNNVQGKGAKMLINIHPPTQKDILSTPS